MGEPRHLIAYRLADDLPEVRRERVPERDQRLAAGPDPELQQEPVRVLRRKSLEEQAQRLDPQETGDVVDVRHLELDPALEDTVQVALTHTQIALDRPPGAAGEADGTVQHRQQSLGLLIDHGAEILHEDPGIGYADRRLPEKRRATLHRRPSLSTMSAEGELGVEGVGRAVQAEERQRLGLAEDQVRHVLAHGRAELEPVPRAAARDPDVRSFGVAVDQEVAVRAVLVLADAGFEQRRSGQPGEAERQVAPRPLQPLRARETLAGGGVERRPSRVVRDLEAAVVVPRNAVEVLLAELDPDREAVQVTRRRAEEEDLLAGGEDPDIREQGGEPGSAGEDVCVGLQAGDLHPPVADRAGPDLHLPDLSRYPGQYSAAPAGHEVAGRLLEEDGRDPLEADLGETPPGLVQPELPGDEPGFREQGEGGADVTVLPGTAQPEHAGRMVEVPSGFAPGFQGAGHPLDVDAVRAVDPPDDAGLAARAGARVPRTPGVDQGHPAAALAEADGGPASKGAGANDCDMKSGHRRLRSI